MIRLVCFLSHFFLVKNEQRKIPITVTCAWEVNGYSFPVSQNGFQVNLIFFKSISTGHWWVFCGPKIGKIILVIFKVRGHKLLIYLRHIHEMNGKDFFACKYFNLISFLVLC